ncbi:MAG TPA: hypothetical protein VM290_06190 [Gaiellaceae bacterium]|nr:hypothetical protein [Gaiellaceae bacterium]
MPAPRVLIVVATVAAAIVLFVLLRPSGEEAQPPAAATEPSSVTISVEPGPAPEPEPEPEPEEPQPRTLSIVLRDGLPVGGAQRFVVRRGEDVRIVVRSDAPDDLHLHGYDLERSVAPGAPAQLRFRATIAGVFELETHRRHVAVAELEVRP